jgi:hypothetical protein
VRFIGRLPGILGLLAGLLGAVAVGHYASHDLTLSHYDAKAHLVVARRILDSITPGWEQIGAVWLPLPHLVNMLPVQIDVFYRTGASAIALSVASAAVAAAALSATVLALTASRSGAVLAAALCSTNPNLLYLQATPMTEPLLFALTSLQVLLCTRWVLAGRLDLPRPLGCVMALGMLTRYEAWPITAATLGLSAWAWWRTGVSVRRLAPVYAHLALFPLLAATGFMLFSRITVGEWFVSGGFFVPDPKLQGQPLVVLRQMREGLDELGGTVLIRTALASLVAIILIALVWRRQGVLVVPLALVAAAVLPFSAFVSGHPFRTRYQVPLLLAASLIAGLGAGLTKRAAPVLAAACFVLVLRQVGVFDGQSPMVVEAEADRLNREGRRVVTTCLGDQYRGETVMASMGSLAHYMQELSHEGFHLADFLHEGNGPLWDSAFIRGPAPLVGWVLVEEQAEGGDAVYQRAQAYPRFFDGFERMCEGGGVALYRRTLQNLTATVPR